MPFSKDSTFPSREVYLNKDTFCAGVKKQTNHIFHPILPQNQQLLKMHSLRSYSLSTISNFISQPILFDAAVSETQQENKHLHTRIFLKS